MARYQADVRAGRVPAGIDLAGCDMAYTPSRAKQLFWLGDSIGAVFVLSTWSVNSDAAERALEEATDEARLPAWPVSIPEDRPTLNAGMGHVLLLPGRGRVSAAERLHRAADDHPSRPIMGATAAICVSGSSSSRSWMSPSGHPPD